MNKSKYADNARVKNVRLVNPGSSEHGGGSAQDAVKYIPQALTTQQKAQARMNINAASVDDVATVAGDLSLETQRAIAAEGNLQQMISAVQGVQFVIVDTLPTASAQTAGGKIYLVPAEHSEVENAKDEYVTIYESGVYDWEHIGSTTVDMTDYLKYTQQSLSTSQKAQARDNIGANATLVSGTNIKTVNNQSLLGSGNLTIEGAEDAVRYNIAQSLTDAQELQARANISAASTADVEELSTAISAKYSKPVGGIPSTDMAAAVQTSLGKADSAYQKSASGIPSTDLASAVQTSLNKADTAYQKPSGGIPMADLTSPVQVLLNLADSAVQSQPIGSIIPPVDPSEFVTEEEFDQLDAKVGESETQYDAVRIVGDASQSGIVRYYTGVTGSSSAYSRTPAIDVSPYRGMSLTYNNFKSTLEEPSGTDGNGMCFYDSSDSAIPGTRWSYANAEAGQERITVSIPSNASTVRFCTGNDFMDINADVSVPRTVYTDGLGKDVQDLQSEVATIGENIYKNVTTPQTVTSGKVYTLTVGSAPSLGDSSSYKCIAVTGLQVGDQIALHGYSGSSYATWGKAKNGLVTYASSKGVEVNTTVECDGTFDAIYVNAYNSRLNPPTASVTGPVNAFDYVDGALDGLENSAPARKNLNILCFGNSFTQGSMGYVPAILQRLAPDVNVTIDMAVIGASPLAQHLAYFTDTEQSAGEFKYYIDSDTGDYIREAIATGSITDIGGYTLLESVNGDKWTSPSSDAKIPAILARKDWNIVTFQQRGASDGLDYDTYFAPFIYKLQKALALQMGHNVQLAWIMTHGAYKTTTAQRLADWENIAENAEKVMQKTGTALLLPYGTAVQNLRTTSLESLGDYDHGGGLLVDEGHLQQGIGCLAASYAIALAILKEIGYGNVGIIGDDLRPDATWLSAIGVNWNIGTGVIGISDANCVLAQMAATAAVNRPYDLTDISVYEETQVTP